MILGDYQKAALIAALITLVQTSKNGENNVFFLKSSTRKSRMNHVTLTKLTHQPV